MRFRIGCLSLVCWMAGFGRGLSADERPQPEEVTVLRDIKYRDGASTHWRLDLAMKNEPRGKPRPAIVVIHGGGWREGDKSSFASRERAVPGNIVDFARLGFVAVTNNQPRPEAEVLGRPPEGAVYVR